MAKQVVALEASFDTSAAEGSVKSLKAQLKEAQAEVSKMADKFGETSKQAADAAKKAAQLKDRIGDAKALTDAFNPDKKFQAFSSALSGVAGGFSAVQGAMGLMGAESKDLEKTMLKVQSAMALSQGLSAITEAQDSFKNLKTVVVDAFKGIKAAIGSTGIGLLVVALAALVANWDAISTALGKVSAAQRIANDTLADYNKGATTATESVNKVKVAFDLAKKGVISKKEALQTYNDTLGDSFGKTNDLGKAEKMFTDKAQVYIQITALKARANALFAKSAEEGVKTITAGQEDQTSFLDKTKAVLTGFIKGNQSALISLSQSQIENTKKVKENSKANADYLQTEGENLLKQAADKSKSYGIATDFQIEQNKKSTAINDAAIKERLAADKQLQEQRRTLAQEDFLKNIKDDDERAKKKLDFDYLNAKQDIENSKASDIEKFQTLQVLYTNWIDDKNAIDAAQKAKKDKEADDALIKEGEDIDAYIALVADKELEKANNAQLSFDERLAAIKEREDLEDAITFESDAARLAYEKANAEARKEIAKEEAAVKIANAQFAADSLSAIADLAGKDTMAGKALAIAAATVSTYLSAQKAYESQFKPLAIVDSPIRGAIAAGIAVATGLSNIKKIMSVQVPGKGGGGGSMPSAGSIPAPLIPQVQSTLLNQGQVNQLSSATSRAFVLESDVSGNQERIQRLNRAARIN